MIRVVGDQLADAADRLLHRLRGGGIHVTQHVDRGIEKVERGEPGPDEDRLSTPPPEGAGGDECGQPRPHDRAVGPPRWPPPPPPRRGANPPPPCPRPP